jgi:arsenate reductase (thioredoxin)
VSRTSLGKRRNFVVVMSAVLISLSGCATVGSRTRAPTTQVLFVCEHGNVKSLMAASYFSRLAEARGLALRGVSRGSAPDSTTVPPKIIQKLGEDGFDVREFHPVAVSVADVSASERVVTIGVALPDEMTRGATVEPWNDIPPASADYAAARAALENHVKALLDEIAARK